MAWSHRPSTQAATLIREYEEVGDVGQLLATWRTAPLEPHCVLRSEMEQSLLHTGLADLRLSGGFDSRPLEDRSPGMIWLPCLPGGEPGRPSRSRKGAGEAGSPPA
jgi:hypothetical protein